MKDQILSLRQQGKTYSQIATILNCSKSVVCYYCGVNQSTKRAQRQIKRRQTSHPYQKKAETYLYRSLLTYEFTYNRTFRKMFTDKVYDFQKRKGLINMPKFTAEDVIQKLGETPRCYLTGQPIDINQPQTYHFDHIIPVSKGGDNSLDNLGICTTQANLMKSDMTPDELFTMCKLILDYQAEKVGNAPTPV